MTFRGPTGISGLWRKIRNLWGEPDADSFLSVVYKESGIGGIEQVVFTLEGDGPFYIAHYNYRDLHFGRRSGEIKIVDHDLLLPRKELKLKIITCEDWNSRLVISADTTWAVMAYYLYLMRTWIDLIYRRLILTCAVWGLADCRHEEIPHWRQLKVFRGDK